MFKGRSLLTFEPSTSEALMPGDDAEILTVGVEQWWWKERAEWHRMETAELLFLKRVGDDREQLGVCPLISNQ
jgi:hypothetical protein